VTSQPRQANNANTVLANRTINTSQLADNGCRKDAHTSTLRLHQTPSSPHKHNGLVLAEVQHKKNKKIKKKNEEDEEKEKEKEKEELEDERSSHAPKRQETLCRGPIVSARMFILMMLSVSTSCDNSFMMFVFEEFFFLSFDTIIIHYIFALLLYLFYGLSQKIISHH
jgi:cation transport ATPase